VPDAAVPGGTPEYDVLFKGFRPSGAVIGLCFLPVPCVETILPRCPCDEVVAGRTGAVVGLIPVLVFTIEVSDAERFFFFFSILFQKMLQDLTYLLYCHKHPW